MGDAFRNVVYSSKEQKLLMELFHDYAVGALNTKGWNKLLGECKIADLYPWGIVAELDENCPNFPSNFFSLEENSTFLASLVETEHRHKHVSIESIK